ncbi:hypothetical protein VTI74DRAFT_10471 [Chaetomium olivicolor]
MDYTRYSSQPATVDLCRADLAEIWTVDDPGVESPKPASVSDSSDMLDLEYIPTPGCRPLKSMKKDPLPDLLNGVLDQTPSRKGRNDSQEQDATNKPSSSGNDEATQAIYEFDSPSVSHHQTKKQKLERSSCLGGQQPQAGRDQSTRQLVLTLDSPGSHSRQSRDAIAKPAPPSKAKKGPARQSKQIKISPKPAKPASTRTMNRAKKRDDIFELSDSTDIDESRPKKRQAKEPPSQKFLASPSQKARARDKKNAMTTGKKGKPSRVPRKLAVHLDPRRFPSSEEASPPLGAIEAVVDDQGEEPALDSTRNIDQKFCTTSKSLAKNQLQVGNPAWTARSTKSRRETRGAELTNQTHAELRQKELPVPGWSGPGEVIMVPSDSAKEMDAVSGSTSSLFMEQDQGHPAASDSPDVTVTVQPGIGVDHGLLLRSPIENRCLGFTPPPSFQPCAFPRLAASSQNQNMKGMMPSAGEGLFSDGHAGSISPPTAPVVGPDVEDSMVPEDAWKQVVEDDSPPTVLHRIVTLLHRSLKPREEAVREIANDYRENALRLLEGLAARHGQEKVDTMAALRKTSQAAFTVFASAGQDMAVLIDRLRDMDVTRTADVLRRPVLSQKIDEVAQLCQAMLHRYGSGAVGEDVTSEPEDEDENLGSIAEAYRLRLLQTIHLSDNRGREFDDNISTQVNEFIKQCIEGQPEKNQCTEARKAESPARNTDEALKVFLDRVLGGMHRNDGMNDIDHAVTDKGFDVVANGTGMDDLLF